MLGLRALGVLPGDEVVTVANTAAPTVVAIPQMGAIPRFVDVDPRTYLMDTDQLAATITSHTRCILPVHLYGQCVDMKAVAAGLRAPRATRARGLRAEPRRLSARPSMRQHRRRRGVLVLSDQGVGACGDGGIVVTDHEGVADRVRRLRFYGMDPGRYSVIETPGHNARLDTVQAEILRRLEQYIARRQRLAARYRDQLEDTELRLPEVAPDNTHVYYVYVVRHPERERIMERLQAEDITVNISYPCPCHLQTGFADLGYREGDLPHTEAAANEIFSLPMYPSLTDAQQDRVCAVLRTLLS